MKQGHDTSVNNKEHVLVCLSASPTNRRIIYEASELASAFNASFTALYVQKEQENTLPSEEEMRLQNNIRYAEDKGATITTVIGENVSYQIAEFARVSKVTKIVIGRSNTSRYHFWERQTLTDQLIAIATDIDIYIIPDSKTDIKVNQKNWKLAEQIIPTWKDLLITALLLVAMTGFGILFSNLGFTESNIITVYILGVLINAILTRSHLCSFISSFCSVLLFNYFFTEPRLTFHAYEPGYSVTFIIMLIAALLTGSLAYRLKDSARESSRAAFRTKVLFDTNQLLQKSRTVDEVLNVTANQAILLSNCDVYIYPVDEGKLGNGYMYSKDSGAATEISLKDSEEEVLKWVLDNKKRAGYSTKVYSKAKCLYLAIRINGTVYGIMGIAADRIFSSFEYSVILSILGECALAIENIKNEKAKEEAAVMAENEKLRANLLRTISHDLRTPLTSISGNASNLLYHYKVLDDDTREQIFTDIYDESDWLIRLVENLLSVTRIENGEMQISRTPEVLDDVIDEAMKHIDRNKTEHNITIDRPDDIVVAEMDAKLIIQVIINIVNNAIKYTPKGSDIKVGYYAKGEDVLISIADNGPGMNDQMKEHAFDMFYTGQNKIADSKKSMGLGLALCKAVVEAHGGSIYIESNTPSGCIVTFRLKKGEVVLDE
ncbi:MAG: DUF4118 domain-containing protein [Butyrivibrio sp.]|uniref:DUF4118 domain-containing protein n=1 Tax=Butyrivibrio sp. TaxID=28121 RepID=UPI0026011D97|nr:DUF4118 domain-containing protein [Butyrivibrio sp.]MCR5771624.1 DUF4118 domain-containing protein [Butyrivibrio sp.]